MPPIYDWKDLQTGKIITIIRNMADSDSLPDIEEATKGQMTEDEYKKAVWEKQMGTFMLTRGRNWNYSKGNP